MVSTDEYHQSLTGYRDGRWMDVGIDGIGILIGILIYHATPILLIIKKKNVRFCDKSYMSNEKFQMSFQPQEPSPCFLGITWSCSEFYTILSPLFTIPSI